MKPNRIALALDGSELPAESNASVVVKDRDTGLMWSHTLDIGEVTHAEAEAACKALTIGGHTDWRLPTRAELLTLVDDTRFRPAIDTALFPDTKSDWYWTSTPVASAPADYAWLVLFYGGNSNSSDRGDYAFVRAVRSVGAGQ